MDLLTMLGGGGASSSSSNALNMNMKGNRADKNTTWHDHKGTRHDKGTYGDKNMMVRSRKGSRRSSSFCSSRKGPSVALALAPSHSAAPKAAPAHEKCYHHSYRGYDNSRFSDYSSGGVQRGEVIKAPGEKVKGAVIKPPNHGEVIRAPSRFKAPITKDTPNDGAVSRATNDITATRAPNDTVKNLGLSSLIRPPKVKDDVRTLKGITAVTKTSDAATTKSKGGTMIWKDATTRSSYRSVTQHADVSGPGHSPTGSLTASEDDVVIKWSHNGSQQSAAEMSPNGPTDATSVMSTPNTMSIPSRTTPSTSSSSTGTPSTDKTLTNSTSNTQVSSTSSRPSRSSSEGATLKLELNALLFGNGDDENWGCSESKSGNNVNDMNEVNISASLNDAKNLNNAACIASSQSYNHQGGSLHGTPTMGKKGNMMHNHGMGGQQMNNMNNGGGISDLMVLAFGRICAVE